MTTLQWITENKSVLNINQIERELGMAQGILSKAIGGRQKMSKKWEKVLDRYFWEKGISGHTINQVIDYIEHDCEIAIPIDRLFKDGENITKKEYGLVMLEILCEELRDKFTKAL